MRAVEVTGTIDLEGHLLLDQPFEEDISSRVRVIVLFSEPVQELEDDPDDTPIEEVKASLKRAFQQAYELVCVCIIVYDLECVLVLICVS